METVVAAEALSRETRAAEHFMTSLIGGAWGGGGKVWCPHGRARSTR